MWQWGDGQNGKGDVVKCRMHFSPFKFSSLGNGKSSTFASSPVMSQSHFMFLVHVNASCCSGWRRTANLALPFRLGFREFKRASSVFVSMETRLGVVHALHGTGNLKQSLGRTSQGDTSGLSGHFPAPAHRQFTKEGGLIQQLHGTGRMTNPSVLSHHLYSKGNPSLCSRSEFKAG